MTYATLALDLGTKTGYALRRATGRVEHGTVSFAIKKSEQPGKRWTNFRRWLVDLKAANPDIRRIVVEDVRRHLGTDAAHAYGAFRAIVEMFGDHHQIEVEAIGVGTWKKRFTGNGAAKKEEVIEACKRVGFQPQTDNDADAIGVLFVAMDACPVLQPSRPPKSAKHLKVAGQLPAQPF
ncbi:MAG: hypothetical protein ING75_17015 [Rhodocyclaceae bacterium]|nr:hypothetical protein [Rhodocyclaceae bacterium]